ncbi:MAG: hypothetical protein CMO26_04030 [Thiotrichales bacterium]|nr:hypothetical protein [Thiotrichales bacterium]
MKRILLVLTVLLVAVYWVWPRAYVHRLDTALTRGDEETLSRLVVLPSVKAAIEQSLSNDVNAALGDTEDGFLGWLKNQVTDLGSSAVDEIIDLEWVRETLMPGEKTLESRVTNGSFEAWDIYVVRVGKLGNQPVHIKMQLLGSNWRVVAIYP